MARNRFARFEKTSLRGCVVDPARQDQRFLIIIISTRRGTEALAKGDICARCESLHWFNANFRQLLCIFTYYPAIIKQLTFLIEDFYIIEFIIHKDELILVCSSLILVDVIYELTSEERDF